MKEQQRVNGNVLQDTCVTLTSDGSGRLHLFVLAENVVQR